MATVNPYEAPQQLSLTVPFIEVDQNYDHIQVLHTGCKCICGSFYWLIFAGITTIPLMMITNEPGLILAVMFLSGLACVIQYLVGLISMYRPDRQELGDDALRDGLVAVTLSAVVLLIMSCFYAQQDNLLFATVKYYSICGLIILTVIHVYQILRFQQLVGKLMQDKEIQLLPSIMAFSIILSFLCIVAQYSHLSDNTRWYVQLCATLLAIIAVACFYAGFSRIQKLIAAQLSNDTTSDHQQ
jgi:hypothetical protein